ncbi:winged helix-turn-helix domain-containing protein [Amycolatopsis acidiphila]|uniref:AfsR/SARP family transcriptional regulator n=1 Tax=Amycolatopsis acidiphila TaxID=715473 RepID=A0A558AK02_9PSEU|nr:BTAD domain-containing putative transcriptional regulator [Amycolatopsis acidiphila]TVT24592.1 AfsR/SARP family transcriptional regulator [Amycolatopsis acidiphila]UIJ58539.1 winged helix-turn-helix domain-containing protein [Amycolatopsis acidiphila]GHG76948.1 SARP family transcriptional regulator [Amycolatopsis acidiphila]
MRFGILGPTLVRDADGNPLPVGGPRPRALLALLLLDAGRVVGTDRLIDGLYGDQPPKEAANALQAQVSRLRRKLGGDLVELRPAGYLLRADPDEVDVHRFTRLVREAGESLGEALALWRGPALADVDAPFAEPQRARLEELRVSAAEDHAEARLALGEATGLVDELRDLAQAYPLRERVHALLMRALSGAGRPAEALTVFEDVRRTLADELGADPAPVLAAAHMAVLRAEPVRAQRVPAQLTSFVGRDEELARIGELLAKARLVTLTGPGGAGKTRLAIEASGHDNGETPFVDLAPLRGGTEVPQAVLSALGLREAGLFAATGPAGPTDRIVSALTDRRMLLVFDNCEHVVEDAAALVHRLLASCPGLRVLATSREPLGITGEVLCPLPPLPPGPAVRLFTERAAAVAPDVALDDEVVQRICAALDGLPLAIELAAARLRTIPPAQLESRLGDRFRLLSRGSRTAAPRHQTLRAVVEWSWDLLSEPEQRLLRRLAVFTGGVTAGSAAAVSDVDAEELLTGLAEKSLLEASNGRFRMLDTIRAYSLERLDEAGERERFSRVHAAYFLDLATTADPRLRGADQLTWLARLTAEHANLQAAVHRAVDADPHLALRLVGALSTYWRLRGLLSEVQPLAARLLAALGTETPVGFEEEYVLTVLTAGPSEVEGQLRRAETIMNTLDAPIRLPQLVVAWALFTGPPVPGAPLTPLARRFAASEDPWFRALAHFSLSYLELLDGDPTAAEREFLVSLETFRSVGDRWGVAQVLDGLAALTELRGEHERSLALIDEAIELVGQLGAVEELAELWYRRADRLRTTDPATAAADYAKSEELARRAGVPATLAMAHLGLGELARQRGDLGEARRWCEQALGECVAGWQAANARSHVLTALGRISQAEGALDEARSRHREAIRIALDNQLRSDLVAATAGAAGLALLDGDSGWAAQLLGMAEALRGTPLSGDPDAARVRTQVGEPAVEAARRMTYAEVTAALREFAR